MIPLLFAGSQPVVLNVLDNSLLKQGVVIIDDKIIE